MAEHDAVQRLRRRIALCRGVVLLVVAVFALVGAPARAATPPDPSGSTLACSDGNGGALRGGDDLSCTLTARLAAGTENATFSATIVLPSTVDVDPTAPPPAYDSGTRTITLGPTVLGFTFSGDQRPFTFVVRVADGLAPGTPVGLTANLTAVGDSDGAVAQASPASTPLLIAPPAATLSDSTVACSDVNRGVLLPGDQVTCTLDVINASGHEDAGSIVASMSFPGGLWITGGSALGNSAAFFGTSALGAIASGTDKTATATFSLSPSLLGGAEATAFASVTGTNVPSGDPIVLSLSSAPLIVAPGPARLSTSALRCDDTNGGLLLSGDDITCVVTVAPTAGYEDVQGTTGTIAIPGGAEWVSGGDSHTATSVSLDTPSLGDVTAGTTKSATFHLRVSSGTAVNTVLQPTGSIAATSVPLGGPVQQALQGNFLKVGQVVAATGEPPPPDQPITLVTPPPVSPPPAVVAKGYTLRAKTIKLAMRKARRGRRSVGVTKYVVRTPKVAGKVIRRVTVPRKGKWAPKRGKVTIKGTKLTYTLKKGVSPAKVKDRFHYTVTDTKGKKATGTVIVKAR